VITICVWHLKT